MARKFKIKGLKNLSDVVLSQVSWKDKALCKTKETSIFFANPKSNETNLAISICKSCPVRQDCFYESIQYGYDGVWGGSTAEQRQSIIDIIMESNITNLDKQTSDILLSYVDVIGKTKNAATADLLNIKSSKLDPNV
jgi:hypothetical protein